MIDWRDKRGASRKTVIPSGAPAALIASIERARAVARVRIEVPESAEMEKDAGVADDGPEESSAPDPKAKDATS